ncbi:GNAT family N-acetyltransferase [Pontibacillus sp. ALD_SL1]|uniref:GNAT family N-acetyltransferase n=1 Tax=Pontibacillus sp. ALD_SL1 TaxID=2777185 RepID=UPI001A96ADBD|nr:GNAT family N-acetyltransferase [Pontibacillus sp. ALD_SL1]QST01140.1 GNAT family N-acetyltransferase [Pontibacillus sp. ALD_SL1]
MKQHLKLVEPSIELQAAYQSYYNEWVESGENIIPFVLQKDPTDFEAMLLYLQNNSKGIGQPEGWLPDSTFWLTNEYNRILGIVNIRHGLTEFLKKSGGHIGYGIRPSERRKGYATAILQLALEKAKELGIQEALVVCDADNEGSMKTILNNGGVQDADHIEENGNVVKRFWIGV